MDWDAGPVHPQRFSSKEGAGERRPASRVFLARCAGAWRPAGPGSSRFRTEHSRLSYLWARTSLSRAAITPRTPSTAASNCAFVKGLRVSACAAERICW